MMPWDHAAIGYVAYSLFVHAVYQDSPGARGTLVVVFASVLPDLIDKPLAWQFGVLGGGRTLGHSVFFALPLILAVGFFPYSRGWSRRGWAFGSGYLLHLLGDVIPTSVRTGGLRIDIILWPVTEGGGGPGDSFYEELMENLVPYAHRLIESVVSGEPSPYLLVLFGIWGFTVLLWVHDGMPVLREGYHWIRRASLSSS